jgi:hypothetical protein
MMMYQHKLSSEAGARALNPDAREDLDPRCDADQVRSAADHLAQEPQGPREA